MPGVYDIVLTYFQGVGGDELSFGLADTAPIDSLGNTLAGLENIIGTEFDDVLLGNSLDNLLSGRGGNDTLDSRGLMCCFTMAF